MRIAICDDEHKILDEISTCIKKYSEQPGKHNIEVIPFDSATALNNALDNGHSFDIFMLDVYIGDEIGTELAKKIRAKGFENPIVFLTTSIDHAPESFESGTLRYLIKPINPEKFFEALDAAVSKAEKLNNKIIKLKTDGGSAGVNVSHIVCTESHGHYQFITLDDGDVLKARVTVTELFGMIEKLGNFIRCGSAYIINIRRIKLVSGDSVRLVNEKRIPIPRGGYSDIKKAFWAFHYEGQGE